MSTEEKSIVKYWFEPRKNNYDKYVSLYNNAGSKLNAVGSLIEIQKHLENKKPELVKSIEAQKRSLIKLVLSVLSNKSGKTNSMNEDQLEDDLKKLLDPIFDDPVGFRYLEKDKQKVNEAIQSLNLKFNSERQKRLLHLKIKKMFQELYLFQLFIHDSLTLNSFINKIFKNGYPEKLNYFNEVSEEEREQITKVGRPLKTDLPQTEIQEFVKGKLYPNGELTDKKVFVHQNGKRKGLPNWNQLALKYFDENPEVELNDTISKRQLIKRIKNAYEVINTSLN